MRAYVPSVLVRTARHGTLPMLTQSTLNGRGLLLEETILSLSDADETVQYSPCHTEGLGQLHDTVSRDAVFSDPLANRRMANAYDF